MAEFAKCCRRCGRWGSRAFVPAPHGWDGWVCQTLSACNKRVRANGWRPIGG